MIDKKTLARVTRATARAVSDQLGLESEYYADLTVDADNGTIAARLPYDGSGYETVVTIHVNAVNVPVNAPSMGPMGQAAQQAPEGSNRAFGGGEPQDEGEGEWSGMPKPRRVVRDAPQA